MNIFIISLTNITSVLLFMIVRHKFTLNQEQKVDTDFACSAMLKVMQVSQKGYAKEDSDVDICVNTTLTGLKFVGFVEQLHQALKKNVDAIRFQELKDNLDLLNEIMKDGIKIYG